MPIKPPFSKDDGEDIIITPATRESDASDKLAVGGSERVDVVCDEPEATVIGTRNGIRNIQKVPQPDIYDLTGLIESLHTFDKITYAYGKDEKPLMITGDLSPEFINRVNLAIGHAINRSLFNQFLKFNGHAISSMQTEHLYEFDSQVQDIKRIGSVRVILNKDYTVNCVYFNPQHTNKAHNDNRVNAGNDEHKYKRSRPKKPIREN